MSESHSTPSQKPSKPRPDFPLFPHATGRWAKKIRGKLHYFGKWDDPDGADVRYLKQRDDLHAGRKPRVDTDAVTVRDCCEAFLVHKNPLVETGELARRTWSEYKAATDRLLHRSTSSVPSPIYGRTTSRHFERRRRRRGVLPPREDDSVCAERLQACLRLRSDR